MHAARVLGCCLAIVFITSLLLIAGDVWTSPPKKVAAPAEAHVYTAAQYEKTVMTPLSNVVALCFFGLVKNIDAEQIAVLNRSIVYPLRRAGYNIRVFLHTFRSQSFANGFSRETSDTPLLQHRSLGLLHSMFPDMVAAVDDVAEETADVLFPLSTYLSAGDPWPFNANQSLLYYLRQQYSLLRVTELWSDVTLIQRHRDDSRVMWASTEDICTNATREEYTTRYRGVVYLRPDLYFLSQLSVDQFDMITAAGVLARLQHRATAPGIECDGVLHPWIVSTSSSEAQHAAVTQGLTPQSPDDHGQRRWPLHIGIPVFEWGGLHDRFAFGATEAMFLYGTRGKALLHYVHALKQKPHAEQFLRWYLCAAGVKVHISPLLSGRRRVAGKLEDDPAPKQRARLLGKRVALWAKWQERQAMDVYGRGTERRCLFETFGALHPLPLEHGEERKQSFRV